MVQHNRCQDDPNLFAALLVEGGQEDREGGAILRVAAK